MSKKPYYIIRVFRDGDEWCALFGEDLQEGVAGFGYSIPDALTKLVSSWSGEVLMSGEGCLFSKCCGALVKVVGRDSSTRCFVCKRCGEPCDVK